MSKQPGKLRLEIEHGYAAIYDERGITCINDIYPGNYRSPDKEVEFLRRVVARWNEHDQLLAALKNLVGSIEKGELLLTSNGKNPSLISAYAAINKAIQ